MLIHAHAMWTNGTCFIIIFVRNREKTGILVTWFLITIRKIKIDQDSDKTRVEVDLFGFISQKSLPALRAHSHRSQVWACRTHALQFVWSSRFALSSYVLRIHSGLFFVIWYWMQIWKTYIRKQFPIMTFFLYLEYFGWKNSVDGNL